MPAELDLRLIAVFSPETRYLATRRAGELRRRFTSLQEYLATQPAHVVPHRRWFNYWTNALGFNDEEFTVPKPTGRFRIMAVGDSFTYGLVPYPQNVMTLLEASLRAACPDRDLDLLNFGIGGTNVADYRTIIELGYATYEPDLVLINVYVGNDGPDLYHPTSKGLSLHSLLRHSYLWSYLRNLLLVRRRVPAAGALVASVQGSAPPGDAAGDNLGAGRSSTPGTDCGMTSRRSSDRSSTRRCLQGFSPPSWGASTFPEMRARSVRRGMRRWSSSRWRVPM